MATRASKRLCPTSQDEESDPQMIAAWRRVFNKMHIYEHLKGVIKLLVNLSSPLVFVFQVVMGVLNRVSDLEEMETMDLIMKDMIQEKRKQERGSKSSSFRGTASTTSFEVISEYPEKGRSRKSSSSNHHGSMNDPWYQSPTSSQLEEMEVGHNQSHRDKCFCGHRAVRLTCHKEGRNFMRPFLRCPKAPESGSQCQYFMWISDTKHQEYSKMSNHGASSPEPRSSKSSGKKSNKKSNVVKMSSDEEEEPVNRRRRRCAVGLSNANWIVDANAD
eukprot:Skav224403  [mRNA]  locus=scaffold657:21435:23301:+ [translate_table: standard]